MLGFQKLEVIKVSKIVLLQFYSYAAVKENNVEKFTCLEIICKIYDSRQRNCDAGRTFGRPFKKMIQAFIPLAFQLGAAATWATVAALVGVKTLAVTLVILKLLLVAGAAKIGALFASKTQHHHQEWTPHQKEIHLHIHNGGYHGDEHSVISPWSRESQAQPDTKHVNVIVDPYAGPQTISTPYGHYMKIEPGTHVTQ